MSKKKRRKKNNKAKKDFNKNVFLKEKVEARREVEMTEEFLFEDKNHNSKSKKIDSSLKSENPKYDKKEVGRLIKEYLQKIIVFSNNYLKKSKITLRKWNNIFCTGMTCKTNLKRDIIIIAVAVIFSIAFILWDRYLNSPQKERLSEDEKVLASFDEAVTLTEEENVAEIKTIQPTFKNLTQHLSLDKIPHRELIRNAFFSDGNLLNIQLSIILHL